MRRAVQMLVLLCVLALVVIVAGCSGSNGAPDGAAMDTAKKPQPPPPPLPPATGTIYYGRVTTGETIAMDTNGANVTVLPLSSAVASGFEVSHASPRFFLFGCRVKDWEGIGVYNLFAQSEAGEAPVNLIDDDCFHVDRAVISLDDQTIFFWGAVFDPAVGDFTEIGQYQASLVYSSGLPTGISGLANVTPAALGALSPDATAGAAAASGSGGARDIFAGSIGGQVVNITNTSGVDELPPAWAPANRIAFGRALVKRGRTTGYNIYTVLPDGSDTVLAVSSTNTGTAWNCSPQAAPAWSPDGTQLAFIARKSELGSCTVMRGLADGSTQALDLTGYADPLIWCVKWRP